MTEQEKIELAKIAELVNVKAIKDLEDLFATMRNSKQFGQFIEHGDLLVMLQINILVSFTISQLVGMGFKCSMINDHGQETPRLERVDIMIDRYKRHFEMSFHDAMLHFGGKYDK